MKGGIIIPDKDFITRLLNVDRCEIDKLNVYVDNDTSK